MQVTLVAHYGRKPPALAAFVHRLHNQLRRSLGLAFQPYDIHQVHATIVGLEGCHASEGIRNTRSGLSMNLSGVVDFLRGEEFAPIEVRIGGFHASGRYSFLSRDLHPHLRSFSIQGERAVAIGWPVKDEHHPGSLDRLRRSFQRFGVRHKWHTAADVVDNDCFLVLGRIDRTASAADVEVAAESVRADLATVSQTTMAISRDTIAFVGYVDSALPLESSRTFRLDEPDLAVKLESLYADCDSTTDRS
jgi:hypothetical protein